MKFVKRGTALFGVALLSLAGTSAVRAAVGTAAEKYPLVYETEGKMAGSETLTYTLPEPVAVEGNALAVNLFVKNTFNNALPLSFSVISEGKEYKWNKDGGDAYGQEPGATERIRAEWRSDGTVEVPYLFGGELFLPFSALSQAVSISRVDGISVTVTAAKDSSFASGDSWVNDGVSLYLYGADCVKTDETTGEVISRNTLADFTAVSPFEVIHKTSGGSTETSATLRKATAEDNKVREILDEAKNARCPETGDMKIIEDFGDNLFSALGAERAAKEWNERYYLSGQISDYSPVNNASGGKALAYHLDSAVFDAGKNSYAGVHFNFLRRDSSDFSGAKGMAVYVENISDQLTSFALELFQYNTDTGLLEQYNLNDAGNKYKTLYAYNTETGEEFSYHTQTFMRVPAKFKGWIRIPFSQYAAPAWSMSEAYGNKGVLNFDKYPVVKISMTRLFNANADTKLIIDNVALYYSDFSVGNLFNAAKPSIKQCVESGKVTK